MTQEAMHTFNVREGFVADKYYVMDRFGHSPAEALVSGPHDTYREAELERRDCNIGDDCEVCYCRK